MDLIGWVEIKGTLSNVSFKIGDADSNLEIVVAALNNLI